MNRNELINHIILNSKISLGKIAKSIGVNRSNIYLWRREKTRPKIKYVNKIAELAGVKLDWVDINNVKIIKDNELNVTPEKSGIEKSKLISLQDKTIKLQIEKIELLEKELKKQSSLIRPAYHFKIKGGYIQETNTWYDAKITGDISMLGFSRDELNSMLKKENNNPNEWFNRYHPDSFESLKTAIWEKTNSDYFHINWNHMMWKNKHNQYLCFNIDMFYDKNDKQVMTLFYHVDGDTDL